MPQEFNFNLNYLPYVTHTFFNRIGSFTVCDLFFNRRFFRKNLNYDSTIYHFTRRFRLFGLCTH
jgi:hypothetical protein